MGVCEALGMLPGTAPMLGGRLPRGDRGSGWAHSSRCQRLPGPFLQAFSHGSRSLLEISLIRKMPIRVFYCLVYLLLGFERRTSLLAPTKVLGPYFPCSEQSF